MAEIDVKAIRDRADAATPGPWQNDDFCEPEEHPLRIAMPDRMGQPMATIADAHHNWNEADKHERRISWKEATANAFFIAAARTDIPALCDAYEAQAKEIERLKGLLREATDMFNDLERFIEHYTRYEQSAYDEPEEPTDEYTHSAGMMLGASRDLSTKIAKELENE